MQLLKTLTTSLLRPFPLRPPSRLYSIAPRPSPPPLHPLLQQRVGEVTVQLDDGVDGVEGLRVGGRGVIFPEGWNEDEVDYEGLEDR